MGIRVLLIEDNPLEREVALQGLRNIPAPPGPADVRTAGNHDEARAQLAACDFDVVLLDFNLPDCTGLDILRELEGRDHAPVVMMTGQKDVQTAVETLRAGAHDYVAKTGAWGTALALAVERVVERDGLERELTDSRRRLEAYAAELEHKVAARTALVRTQAGRIEELCLKIEESARLKSEIIANVSHELRTPLTSILGYADLLSQDIQATGTDDARRMLDGVRTQADRLRHLVESLLALGRLRTGAEAILLSRFPLAGVVEEMRAEAEILRGDGELHFEFLAPSDTCIVDNDRDKVVAIAYHLLSNAIKFTHAGRIALALERTAGGGILLQVSDTGIGLPPESRALIFEDFRQLDGSSTRRYEGIGLGLGIVKRYTALLRGSLRVESEPGRGTTITIDLPAPDRSDARDADDDRGAREHSQRSGH